MPKICRLIFDADDTLWENNIYYEEVRDALFDLAESHGIKRNQAEGVFISTETRIVRDSGYGTPNFLRILNEICDSILPDQARPQFDRIFNNFKYRIYQPRRLFPGVKDTLKYLHSRYELYVLTKGDLEEQSTKLQESGLMKYFIRSFIESEKNLDTYKELLRKYNWSVDELCMIGNSPKSDINPAIRLGMRAIYIPYPHTWYLDNEPIVPNDSLLQTISTFSDLKNILK